MTTAIACTKPFVKPITTSCGTYKRKMEWQKLIANPFCVCKCHIWVKLCAEQLSTFCTSRSPIGCGKSPLQLVISQFDMPPLYLYIIIPFTRIESKIAQWQNQSAKPFYTWNETANAHSRVRKSLTKQNRFKMHQKYANAHVAQKQASLYGMRYP